MKLKKYEIAYLCGIAFSFIHSFWDLQRGIFGILFMISIGIMMIINILMEKNSGKGF